MELTAQLAIRFASATVPCCGRTSLYTTACGSALVFLLHSGCVIGADGFGFALVEDHYEKFPQVGTVEIEDDVEIGANSCVDRAALGVTRIGQGTKLDNMVHIAHNCQIGRHVVIAAQTGFSGGVTVGDYAVIGGQVGVGDKATIESRAVVGSGAGILDLGACSRPASRSGAFPHGRYASI